MVQTILDAYAWADEPNQYGNAMKTGYKRAAAELAAPVGEPIDRARHALDALRSTARATHIRGGTVRPL